MQMFRGPLRRRTHGTWTSRAPLETHLDHRGNKCANRAIRPINAAEPVGCGGNSSAILRAILRPERWESKGFGRNGWGALG